MKLLSSLCCLLVVSVNLCPINVQAQLSDIKLLFNAVKTIYDTLPAVKEHLEEKEKTPEQQMLTGQRTIINKLNQLSDDVASAKERILSKITRTLSSKLSQKIDEIFKFVKDIDISYNNLQHMNNKRHDSERDLLQFARVNTGYSLQELPAIIDKMHSALVDMDINKESVLSIIVNSAYEYDTLCLRGQSAQQLIYDLYKIVLDSDIKGLLVKHFSYDILKKYEKDTNIDYAEKFKREEDKHLKRLTNTYNKVKTNMELAPRIFWVCGLVEDKLGVTYAKLKVFQGFFVNELDMTDYGDGIFSRDSAKYRVMFNACKDYVDESYRCNSEECKKQSEDRKCYRLRDCSYLSNNFQVCHSPPGSDRRYDWMRLIDSDDKYGDYYDTCENKQDVNTLSIGYALSICFCNCENRMLRSLRYFSLVEVESDVQRNKVVTGVRLQKVGYIISLQIQQGELAPNGQITGEVEWKPIEDINQEDLFSRKVSVNQYKEWVDFYEARLLYTVTYNTSTLYLDDIKGTPDYVVTGVRFRRIDKALRFEVQFTGFDATSGTLDWTTQFWNFNEKLTPARREAKANVDDIPTNSQNLNTHSGKDQFVRFKMSDLHKDVSQNTIPFIDLQPVVTSSPLPLSGVGIFYKHDGQHAGYIALRAIHYNLAAQL